ncbi:MAG TPA: sugar phosphate isomerase/epimerase [Candidatus Baltobacteraceae bacterium]|nr:sugar phosphate isomerase/epimerase [Candidatus Baltobacteraceae bacterium]
MNKLAIITGFLGETRNRYMVYQGNRSLAEKFAMLGKVRGVDGVELCYPADFEKPAELIELLQQSGMGVSGVNFRSRRSGKWWRGAFIAEQAAERQELVDDLRRCMDAAAAIGCARITTCPLNDGADTLFEVDYIKAYDDAAATFSAGCAHNPAIRICIEYKKSDPIARCLLGTAGETAAFCLMTGAPNLGATLDIGHALYAGERPAQSAALLARANRLFYVHLNDNDGSWDWDMLPGAFHLWEFVELFYTLNKLGYRDDWYAFDVYPKELDTVENFSAAMSLTRKLEAITARIDSAVMDKLLAERNSSKTIPYLYSLL